MQRAKAARPTNTESIAIEVTPRGVLSSRLRPLGYIGVWRRKLEKAPICETVSAVVVIGMRGFQFMCQRWGGFVHDSPRRSGEGPVS